MDILNFLEYATVNDRARVILILGGGHSSYIIDAAKESLKRINSQIESVEISGNISEKVEKLCYDNEEYIKNVDVSDMFNGVEGW